MPLLILIARAGLFGLGASLLAAAIFRLAGKRPLRDFLGTLAKAFYFAALTEIIALRGVEFAFWGGIGPESGPIGLRQSVQWIPLATVVDSARSGPLFFLYHTAGNLIWFMPLGLMLRGQKWRLALMAGLALSACLEAGQWLLATGMPDVDDVLLNGLGAVLGWLAGQTLHKRDAKPTVE